MITPGSMSGVWLYPSREFPGEDDHLWVDETRRRMIFFHIAKIDPVRRLSVRAWYRQTSDTQIATRIGYKGVETLSEVSFREGHMVWKRESFEFEYRRLSTSEVPEWMEEKVVAANAKMDEMEKKG